MAPESRVIRVDEDIFKALQKRATPLEDTPSSVIRRLIEEIETRPDDTGDSHVRATSDKRAPVRSPERTPQRAFRRPILEALVQMGGRGPVDEVLAQVYEKVKRQLSKFDHTTISTGEERWRVYARWARKSMELEGLIKGPRGVWEITEKGRLHLQNSRS